MEKKKENKIFIISLVVALGLSLLIRLADPLLDRFTHLPDQGPTWYYWKLPQPENLARITAWLGYGLQQLFTWLFVRAVMKSLQEKRKASLRLSLLGLLGSLFFIVLHFMQTHLFYDGLAQDVPIFTSQDSVIGMLIVILIMAIPARGLFFGKKIPVKQRVIEFIRNYHGYFITWALVYTFWFHPMDGDWILVIGFFYMFLLFIQVGLAATSLHFNLAWITVLEAFVAVHATVVAVLSGQAIWPMFLFGFLGVLIITQIYGLKLPIVVRLGVSALYLIGAGVVYYFRGYEKIYEITFIPLILYAGALLLIIMIQFGQWLVDWMAGIRKEIKKKPLS